MRAAEGSSEGAGECLERAGGLLHANPSGAGTGLACEAGRETKCRNCVAFDMAASSLAPRHCRCKAKPSGGNGSRHLERERGKRGENRTGEGKATNPRLGNDEVVLDDLCWLTGRSVSVRRAGCSPGTRGRQRLCLSGRLYGRGHTISVAV